MSDDHVTDRIETRVKQARQLCGCSQCQGGYEIGARTLALQPGVSGPSCPSSCVAAVVLAEMFTRLRY